MPLELASKKAAAGPFSRASQAKPAIVELLDIAEYTHQKTSSVPPGEPLFQPFPAQITFANYQPFQEYKATLRLRNNDTVIRRVRVVPPKTPYFTVSAPRKGGAENGGHHVDNAAEDGTSKVVAGMEVSYIITFRPNSTDDYSADLTIVTEREKFVVRVVAIGARAVLNLPESVQFPTTPLKKTATKTLLVTNTGPRGASFSLRCTPLHSIDSPYTVSPSRGSLAPGDSLSLTLRFTPRLACEDYVGTLRVVYDGEGEQSEDTVRLVGAGCEVNVGLSFESVELATTFVGQRSQRTLKVVNRSNGPVHFEWKRFGSEGEEREARLAAELSAAADAGPETGPDMDTRPTTSQSSSSSNNSSTPSSSSSSSSSSSASRPSSSRPSTSASRVNVEENDDEDSEIDEALLLDKSLTSPQRQLQTLRIASAHDRQASKQFMFLYEDAAVSIYPLEGDIWPGGECLITVGFAPGAALDYTSVAYCDITGIDCFLLCTFVGRAQRLPLKIRARGEGPVAVFAYDTVDVGDVFFNSLHRYEVELQNRGGIPAPFRLLSTQHSTLSPDRNNNRFTFEPEFGVVPPAERQPLFMMFESATLGAFDKTFAFNIEGCTKPLELQFKGVVIGPTFALDCKDMHFGLVAHGFPYAQRLAITNTSEIPMTFALRCVVAAGEGVSERVAEGFTITPQQGAVPPGGNQEIEVVACLRRAGQVRCTLVVDMPSVGENLASVPIFADCQVPKVSLLQDTLDFGSCFLRHPYASTLTLVNESTLPALFTVLPQDEMSQGLAVYTADPPSGQVPALGQSDVTLTLATERLGGIRLPVGVSVGGMEGVMEVILAARSTGPVLELAGMLDFGKVDVLKEHKRVVKVRNASLIPAEFKVFITGAESVFSVDVREGIIPPSSFLELGVSVTLDDTARFADTLNVLVIEGQDYAVTLSAVGSGSTIVCDKLDEAGSVVHFGHQFTDAAFSKEFVLQNAGRRPLSVTWINENDPAAVQAANAKNKKGSKTPKDVNASHVTTDTAIVSAAATTTFNSSSSGKVVFMLLPDKAVIPAKSSWVFILSGQSSVAGVFSETLVCRTVGAGGGGGKAGGNQAKDVYRVVVDADVAVPRVGISTAVLSYVYAWQPGVPLRPQTQALTLRNVSKLPLELAMRTTPPFFIDRPHWNLSPDEGATVNVTFSPAVARDKVSSSASGRITVSYADSAQKDYVDLLGEVSLPNLEIRPNTAIDFGCVQNDTSARKTLTLTNVSKVEVHYSWAFIEEGTVDDDAASTISSATSPKGRSSKPRLPANQVFDILPFRGTIPPGQSETTEIVYYAHPGSRYKAVAVCEVEGGPEYEITMEAEAGMIKYSLDVMSIDAGATLFCRPVEKEFYLANTGKVPFDFRVDTSPLSRAGVVQVHPLGGVLAGGDRQRFLVRVTPGLPERVVEKFRIEVAHFEPCEFTVYAEGVYPAALLSLPRPADDVAFEACLAQARANLSAHGPRGPTSPITSPTRTSMQSKTPLRRPRSSSRSVTSSSVTGGPEGGLPVLRPSSSRHSSVIDSPRAGAISPVYTPSAEEVETEADRLALRAHLVGRESNNNASLEATRERRRTIHVASEGVISNDQSAEQQGGGGGPHVAGEEGGGGGGGGSPPPSPTRRQPRSRASTAPAVDLSALTLAQYVCDFGAVTKGTSRRKTFRVTNSSFSGAVTGGISLTVADKHRLAAAGLTVDPDNVLKLPEGESVELSVTLQTAKADVAVGTLDKPLRLTLKGGPALVVHLRALVEVPEMRLSADAVDFGRVQVGHCKVVTVQLHNHKSVQCEWAVKKPTEGVRDWELFETTPASGTLAPGECANVEIKFTPNAERDGYAQKIPIKVNYNTKGYSLNCKASAYSLRIRADPQTLSLSPLLPSAPPTRALLTLRNDSEASVEILAPDFDKQWMVDEDAVRHGVDWAGSVTGDRVAVRPRQPGMGLQVEIVEAYQKKKRMEKLEQERRERLQNAAEGKEGDAAEGAEIGDLESSSDPTAVTDDSSVNIVLSGPPHAGASALASALAQRYNLLVVNTAAAVDTAITYATDGIDNASDAARAAATHLDNLVQAAAAAAADKSKKKGAAAAAKEVKVELSEDLVAGLLREAMGAGDDSGADNKGYVFDGVESKHASAHVVAKAIALALGQAQSTSTEGDTDMSNSCSSKPTRRRLDFLLLQLPMEDAIARRDALAAEGEANAPDLTLEASAGEAEGLNDSELEAKAEADKVEEEEKTLEDTSGDNESKPSAKYIASDEQIQGYYAALSSLRDALGSIQAPDVSVRTRDIPCQGLESPTVETLLQEACRTLPDWRTAEERARDIPEPFTLQILKKPKASRPVRAPVLHFSLYTPTSNNGSAEEGEMQYSQQTRWVVPARGSVQVEVRFASAEVGTFEEAIVFEALGGEKAVSVACKGVCAYPQISQDYRNVFYRKVKVRPASAAISKQYVVSKGVFDFGPLLAGKLLPPSRAQTPSKAARDSSAAAAAAAAALPSQLPEAQVAENRDRFRITNNGLFDVKAELYFKNQREQQGEAPQGAKEGAKGGPAAGAKKGTIKPPESLPVFSVDPMEILLRVDETRDVVISAFPSSIGLVSDILVVRIDSNPVPVEFPVQCTGATPVLEVEGADVKFERLLVGHTDNKEVKLKNASLLPLKWKIVGGEGLPAGLAVSETQGALDAGAETIVKVTLTASEKAVLQHKMTLQVFDSQELRGIAQEVPITIAAEAYKIEVDVQFPSGPDKMPPYGGLDFGVLRVQDDAVRTFTIANTGKYRIGFALSLGSTKQQQPQPQQQPNGKEIGSQLPLPARSAATAIEGLFTISPMEGVVEPGAKQPTAVTVHFNRDKLLAKEVELRGNTEIQLAIVEVLTGKKEHMMPVRVDLRAVFSKYNVLPARGMNFGPLVYNTTSNPRTFEIQNSGEFPFAYSLFSYGDGGADGSSDPQQQQPLSPTSPGRPGTASKQAAAATDLRSPGGTRKTSVIAGFNTLQLGNFSLTPCSGTVPPGAVQQVSIVFVAEKARTYVEVLGIDIAGRDPADHPGGIPYEIAGESCIPGLSASDLDGIFEEQRVVAALDPFDVAKTGGGVFSKRERTFYFGPAIARMNAATGEKAEGGAFSHAVQANLKLTNPNKVATTVECSLKPKQPSDGKPQDFPMDVQPRKVEIPPHEHRYVTLSFAPTAIQTYCAVFEAAAENGGGDPRTRAFSCDVVGEGCLPHVSIHTSTASASSEGGGVGVKFPRVLPGKRVTAEIRVKNYGTLAAKTVLEWGQPNTSDNVFDITPKEGLTASLESNQSQVYEVSFAPRAPGQYAHEATLVVKHNPFESQKIKISGECYVEDVTFVGLPDGYDDELHFGDGAVGEERTVQFLLKNHSGRLWRFAWPTAIQHVTFTPAIGHIHKGGEKAVTAVFRPEEPAFYNNTEALLALSAIEYDGDVVEWDDTHTSMPEPAYLPVDGGKLDKKVVLKVHGVADNARYECDAKPVVFRPTMMHQARTYTFPLKNTSKAKMTFNFSILKPGERDTADTTQPYTVKPQEGEIDAGAVVDVCIRFAPLEVGDCARVLVCDMGPGRLEPGFQPLRISLDGRVTRPWCHFDLPDSNYLSAGRRNPELRGPTGTLGPLDPNTRVVEFDSLGTKVKSFLNTAFEVRNTRRFFVLNPTSISYEFHWIELTPDSTSSSLSPFRCANAATRGVITPGRRYEMAFEYTPEVEGTQESFWEFRIPEREIVVPFLMVGRVVEPNVGFDRANVNFKQILVGAKGKELIHLVNGEHVPFTFSLDRSSYDTGESSHPTSTTTPLLTFSPSSGTVPPNSSLPIEVLFAPAHERAFNFNVTCAVRKKPAKLSLNIKGEGYAIHDSLVVEMADGQAVQLGSASVNQLDFGQVLINEKSSKKLFLVNAGSINFDFVWDIGNAASVTVSPAAGTVSKGDRIPIDLTFSPRFPESLDALVACAVVNSRRYRIRLAGVGHRPKLAFSFTHHDFGLCFIDQPGLIAKQATLVVSNDDTADISFDLVSEPSPHIKITSTPTVLSPGSRVSIPVVFTPQAAAAYREIASFDVNGLFTVNVVFTGEGTPLKVELLDPVAQKNLQFGAVRPGHEVVRVVKVVNRSRIAATVSMRSSLATMERYAIALRNAKDTFTIKPKDVLSLDLSFHPLQRTRPFSEDLLVEVAGVSFPLLTMSGACLGIEVKLAGESLPFGTVVDGARATKRIQLENTGDVRTKFTWDVSSLAPHFSISPSDGYVVPNGDAVLEVSFHPSGPDPDIRVERVECRIDGGVTQHLTLTGACAPRSQNKETVEFTAPARGTMAKKLRVVNGSSGEWVVRPTVSPSEHWAGASEYPVDTTELHLSVQVLVVPAGGAAEYAVTYRPSTMSTSSSPHLGTAFFPLPDGTAILYGLSGVATEPLSAGPVVKHVFKAKSAEKVALMVANWMSRPQRFRVVVDVEPTSTSSLSSSTSLKGVEYIDVPALSAREATLRFYAFIEGVTKAKVTFINEDTGEYLWYTVEITASAPGIVEEKTLECPVRQRVMERISITNPLGTDVSLKVKCDSGAISVSDSLYIKASSEGALDIAFRPLLASASDASLVCECPELGRYQYLLHLKGAPAGLERVINFNVPLGGRQTQPFRFMHYLNAKAEYACRFGNKGQSGFEVDPTVVGHAAGPEGIEVEVDIAFEPTRIGDYFQDVLTVSNNEAGEHVVPVTGHCIPPKPQGPFTIKAQGSSISFKNVFAKQVDFTLAVDNPAFTVSKKETITPKKTVSLAVSYKPVAGQPANATNGKLIVTCAESPAPWVFYLQGQ
eukprot:jgi/Chlat1/6242/Chrsp44S05765